MGSIYKRGPGRNGRDHNAAKRLLAEREGDIAKGVPVSPDASRFKFDDAVPLLLDNYRRKDRRSISDVQRRIDLHLLPHFGGLRMSEITTDVIDAFVAKRKEAGAANGTINRELAALKRMFTPRRPCSEGPRQAPRRDAG